jgi:hypothetical protein
LGKGGRQTRGRETEGEREKREREGERERERERERDRERETEIPCRKQEELREAAASPTVHKGPRLAR